MQLSRGSEGRDVVPGRFSSPRVAKQCEPTTDRVPGQLRIKLIEVLEMGSMCNLARHATTRNALSYSGCLQVVVLNFMVMVLCAIIISL